MVVAVVVKRLTGRRIAERGDPSLRSAGYPRDDRMTHRLSAGADASWLSNSRIDGPQEDDRGNAEGDPNESEEGLVRRALTNH